MDPKELKALLKEAKDGLKSKDFATTTKNCKTILKKEPEHYQANLYLGTAMKEQGKWQQAIECYKKATDIDPGQVYAWQGIILVYEKQGIKVHKDLLDAYKRVATFFEKDDKQKYIESTKKLAYVLISQEDHKSALKVITRLSKSVGVDVEMAGVIVQLLSQTKWDTRTEDQNVLYTSALETIVTESPQPPEETCKKYFTQVNRAGDYEQVITQALAMRDRWNTYHSPMEWICRYYMEGRIDPKSQMEIGPMDILTEKLFKLYPSSSFGHFARGKFLIDGELNMNEGFGFMRTGLESNFNLHALLALVEGKLKYGDFEGVLEDCQAGLVVFDKKDTVASRKLKLFALEALIWLDTGKAKESLDKLKAEFQNEDAPVKEPFLFLEGQLCVRKLDVQSLRKVFEQIEKSNLVNWKVDFYRVLLTADLENPETARTVFDDQIAQNPENLELRIMSAIVLFDLKEFNKSGEILLKVTEKPKGAALPLPWKYLGLLYSVQENVRFAAKCFRKSYELCQSTEVGALLSDAYFTIDEKELNLELLTEATKSFSKSMSKWAWLRLGVLNLNLEDATEAVNAFQAAIRSDILDCNVWESLADAYFMRGSYSAALSTYNKALTLGADPMYPKLKIGVVYRCLTQYDDSIATLNELLKDCPNHTPVLVELARTYSLIAQEMSAENFDVGALKAVEDALVYAVQAIKYSSTRVLLPWKIVGDAPLILSNVPEGVKIKVPDVLLGEPQPDDNTECMRFKEIDFDKFKEIGTRALLECLQVINSEESSGDYSKAIKAYIYHQLALSYFNRAQTPTGQVKYPDFFKKALVCVKKAVAANPGNHIYWNTLGVVSFFYGSDELAQHGFIKSLNLESNNVVAWCNLGFVYLKHKNDRLAHQAFAKAQSVAPLYSQSWIGQGLVAENLAPKEAADLFRHAAHLSVDPFAVSCYTDWVCRLLLNDVFGEEDYWFSIVRVDALTIVNDLVTRVERRLQSPHLFNMKGIAAASNGFYETALESFTTALDLCSVPGTQFPVTEEEMKHIFFNRITILVKMGKYEEAREVFSTVEELGTVGFLNAALTLAKLGDLESSEQLYLQLDDRLENDRDKLDLKIALAMIASKAGRPDVACTLLSEKFMIKNPHALLALSAMGVLSSNVDIVAGTMWPLKKLLDNEDFVADVGLMRACFQIMQGSTRSGVNELLKLLRMYPGNARLWSLTAQMLYRYQLSVIPASALRNVTLKALRLSSSKGKQTEEASITSQSSAMISLSYLIGGDWKTAIPTALKGIRKYPEVRENWVVLAFSLWHKFVDRKCAEREVYDKLVKLLEKELELNRVSTRAQAWIREFLRLINQCLMKI